VESSGKGLLWSAAISLGLAALGLPLVTLRWSPDCGGVAYGFPLPYVQTFPASSLEFELYWGPLLLDLLAYSLALAIPVHGLMARVRAMPRPGRRALRGVLAAATIAGTLLECSMMVGVSHTEAWPHKPMYVHGWSSKELYVGLQRWSVHLEGACN